MNRVERNAEYVTSAFEIEDLVTSELMILRRENIAGSDQASSLSEERVLLAAEEIEEENRSKAFTSKRKAPNISSLTDDIDAKKPKQEEESISLGGVSFKSEKNSEHAIKHEPDVLDDKILLSTEEETLSSILAININEYTESQIWEQIRQMSTEDLQVCTFKYLSGKEMNLHGYQALREKFIVAQQDNAIHKIEDIYEKSKCYNNNEAIMKASCKDDIKQILRTKNKNCRATDVIYHSWVYLKDISETCGPNPKPVISQTLAKVEEGFEKLNFIVKDMRANGQENSELHSRIIKHKKIINRILSKAIALADAK